MFTQFKNRENGFASEKRLVHKSGYEFVAMGGGFSVKNNGTVTPVINQDGTLNGTSVLDNNSVTSAKLATSTIQYAETALTNANMLALRATPITVVAAPGAGNIIEFVSAVLCFDRAGAYTETDDNLAFKYTDGSGQAVSETIECTGFVDAAGDAVMPAKPVTSAVILTAAGVNQAVVLHNTGNGEFGGGNAANEVLVKVAYRVHATGF